MQKASKLLSDEIVSLAESGLKKTSNLKNKLKLQVIIAAKKHGIKKVAEIYNVNAATINKWIHRLREESLEGLNHKPKKPRSPFTQAHKKAIENLLINNSDMTIEDLRNRTEKELGLKMSHATLYKIMQKLGFTYTPSYKYNKKNQSSRIRWRQPKS